MDKANSNSRTTDSKTRTLDRIWGLSWLDGLNIKTLPMSVLLVLVGIILGGLFGYFPEGSRELNFGTSSQTQWSLLLAIPVAASFANLALTLIIVRATERTLLKLIAMDRELEHLKQQLGPSFKQFGVAMALTIAGYFMLLIPVSQQLGISIVEVLRIVPASDSWVLMFHFFISMPCWIVLTTTIALAAVFQHFLVLNRIVSTIRIDLIRTQDYAPVSTPIVSIIIVMAVMLCIGQVIGLMAQSESGGIGPEVTYVTIFISYIMITVLGLFLIPVWKMRTRIKAEKDQQLDIIASVLYGDQKLASEVIHYKSDEPLTNGELLSRQLFVESRWEWPIATHVQQLIIFCLLPPLTWVLAAVVENLMF